MNESIHKVAEKQVNIRVEVDELFNDKSLHTNIEYKIMEKILDCSLDVDKFFNEHDEIQKLKIFVNNNLIYDVDRTRIKENNAR